MTGPTQTIVSVIGRVFLSTIFLLSAVGNKIPNFDGVSEFMGKVGIPAPRLMLVGAITFLILGSASVMLGYKARIGASLLLVFLVLATYYFHNFWDLEGQPRQEQMVQFMKNLSMAGAMIFLIANGSGAGSLDSWEQQRHISGAATAAD